MRRLLSILVSVHGRRVRETISLVYMLELGWLFVPTFITLLMPSAGAIWVKVYEWIRPVNVWIAASSPFHVAFGAGPIFLRPASAVIDSLLTVAPEDTTSMTSIAPFESVPEKLPPSMMMFAPLETTPLMTTPPDSITSNPPLETLVALAVPETSSSPPLNTLALTAVALTN